MPADPVLVLAGLVLAHLVADFVLQTDRIVRDKGASGRRAWRGLGLHGAAVVGCLLPFPLAFGTPGWAVLAVVTASHVGVDRAKVVATRRAEARALAEAHARHAGSSESATTLGPAWTPLPAALFALDQALHLAVLVAAWTTWLADAVPLPAAAATLDALVGGWDPAVVHRVAVATLVLVGVVIVNVRAGALFVAVLVRPREAVHGEIFEDPPVPVPPRPVSWRLRLGPFEATAEPAAAVVTAGGPASGPGGNSPGEHASPVRVGATIGVLERLLIVALMLTGAQSAVGFVVAAKTIARFRQLDDRDFAEYYLLGTLASVAVAIGSALVADAALATVGL